MRLGILLVVGASAAAFAKMVDDFLDLLEGVVVKADLPDIECRSLHNPSSECPAGRVMPCTPSLQPVNRPEQAPSGYG